MAAGRQQYGTRMLRAEEFPTPAKVKVRVKRAYKRRDMKAES